MSCYRATYVHICECLPKTCYQSRLVVKCGRSGDLVSQGVVGFCGLRPLLGTDNNFGLISLDFKDPNVSFSVIFLQFRSNLPRFHRFQ